MADLIVEFLQAVDGAGERVIPESALAGGVAEEQQAQFDAFLARLEAAGLIADVSPADVDRRFVHVAVTDAGRKYVADQGA